MLEALLINEDSLLSIEYVKDLKPIDYYNMSTVDKFKLHMTLASLEYKGLSEANGKLKELSYTEKRVKYLLMKDGEEIYFENCKELQEYFGMNILKIRKLERESESFVLHKVNRSLFVDKDNNILGKVDRKVY